MMAKSPARKASSKKSKPAKAVRRSVPKKAPKAVRKAAPKAPAKAKPAKRAAPKPKKDDAHEHHMAEVRAQVARRRPGMGAANVPHEHQDPSLIAPPAPPPAPVDHLHGNYGDAKARSVARNDNPTNWFRQAPKPKSK